MNKILAIDQSLTNTGIVVMKFIKEEEIYFPVVLFNSTFKTKKPENNTFIEKQQRVERIIEHIKKIIKTFNPSILVLESLAYGAKTNSADILGYLFYKILELDELVPVVVINSKKMKKQMTGKGNATKEDLQNIAKTFGYDFNDEHQTDAFCLGLSYFYFQGVNYESINKIR